MKIRPKEARLQPDWVCTDCGKQWGRWWEGSTYVGPTPHCATYHIDVCDVCKKEKSVTEARDHGFLRKGWNKKINE